MLNTLLNKIDKSKAKLDSERPLNTFNLKQVRDYYRIGLTYSSNALEGNSLTISETKIIIEDGLTIGGKPLKDFYETIGHSKSYDYMLQLVNENSIKESYIKELHNIFYNKIDEKNAGEYRSENVIITGSNYSVTDYKIIEKEMKELEVWCKNERDNYHPVVFSALLHKKFIFIHPFIDGNGRTARLLMNLALFQKGYELAIIPPICRNEYISLLELAHIDEKKFIYFIAERVYETGKDMLRLFNINN